MKKRTKESQSAFSPSEWRILKLLIEGRTSNESAEIAELPRKTVNRYRRRIITKLLRLALDERPAHETTAERPFDNDGPLAAADLRMMAILGLAGLCLTPAVTPVSATADAAPRGAPSDRRRLLTAIAQHLGRVVVALSAEANAGDEIIDALFGTTRRGIVISDVTGNIVRASGVFARTLGYTAADLRGKAIAAITAGDDGDIVPRLLADEPEVVTDRQYRAANGSVLWARERSALGPDRAGKPGYVVTRIDYFGNSGRDPLEVLSGREREVLGFVVSGHTSKEIASRLGISAASVDTYRRRLMLKLGIDDLPGLVRFAIRHGIGAT